MRFPVLVAVIAAGILSAPAQVPVHAQAGTPVLLLLGNFNAIDFGPVGVGIQGAPKAVMLTNGGTAAMSITSVGIGGADAADFTILGSTCTSLAPAGVCTVTIGFTPSANGARSGRLLVSNNAPGAPHMIVLGGRGVDPNVPQRAVGPTDPRHGFASTFTDEGGVTVELCLVGGLCLAPAPDPTQPPSVTDTFVNFGAEAFWWSGDAAIIDTANDVDIRLTMAQEAAFQTETPAVGDQIAFGRIRFRMRGTGVANGAWYRFTYPFGVEEFQAAPDIFATSDVGCFTNPCDFTQTFDSAISHFLACVSPAPPAGYLGDFNIPCAVTGSPLGTNFLRVERISGPNGVVQQLVGETNLFAISGKIGTLITPPPPTNRPPSAVNDAATTAVGVPVTVAVLANDSDADGDPMTVSGIVVPPANGVVAIGPGATSVVYTPNAGFTGLNQFTYAISDGRGGTASAVVTVSVAQPNRAPTANSDAATTVAGVPVIISVLANDTDLDNDPLTVTGVSGAVGGTPVVNANGTITYTPAAGFSGAGSFTYAISDGRGGTASALVSITVAPGNRAPIAVADTASTAAGLPVTIDVLLNDSDPDGDPLTISSVAAIVGGSVVINADRTVTYSPAAGFSGFGGFTYGISDGRGGTATATVSVSVTVPNRAPIAVADTATTNAGVPVTIGVLQNDSDPDLDALTVISTAAITGGTAVINANSTVTYTPAAGFTGAGGFTYTIRDARGLTASANVAVTVNPVTPPSAGLVLALGFNEATGITATDASPSLNNGTIREALRVAGRAGFGSALQFDGINDWVTVNDAASLDLTSGMTFEAWVRPSALGGWRTVLMKERTGGLAYGMYADDGTSGARPASYMRIGAIDQSIAGLSAVPLNTWTHLATTYDGATLRFYVNGTLVRSRAQTGAVVTSGSPLHIGGNAIWGEFFAGSIDEVRVYNRALTAAEIQTDMTTPLP